MSKIGYGIMTGAVALLAVSSQPSHAIGVFLHGFSGAGSSGGGTPGTQTMAEDFAGMIPGDTFHGSWRAQSDAVAKIKAAKEANPDEKVVLVGHSYGGDSVDEVAESLKECDICVDVYIQIDTVGAFDDTTPSNVKCGYNIYSTSKDGVNGESEVDGSDDIPVDDTSHTGIDDKDDKGESPDKEYMGKNGYTIVKCVLDEKLPDGRTSPTGPVLQLQEFDDISSRMQHDAMCVAAPLAHQFNTEYEDKWFENFDFLDAVGYNNDELENYVDRAERLIGTIDAAGCDLNALRRAERPFLEFIGGLAALGGGSPLAEDGLAARGSFGEEETLATSMGATPNPFSARGNIAINFSLSQQEDVSLTVFDARGRRVQQLHRGELGGGTHSVSWDGKDQSGREVAGGVYFAVLRTPTGTRSIQLARMK